MAFAANSSYRAGPSSRKLQGSVEMLATLAPNLDRTGSLLMEKLPSIRECLRNLFRIKEASDSGFLLGFPFWDAERGMPELWSSALKA